MTACAAWCLEPTLPLALSRGARRTSSYTTMGRTMGSRVLLRLKCKPGMEQEYHERHQHVWDAVKADLARAGVERMDIWMERTDVFLLMELAPGVAYAAATRLLDASPDSIKWEEYMEPIMLRFRIPLARGSLSLTITLAHAHWRRCSLAQLRR